MDTLRRRHNRMWALFGLVLCAAASSGRTTARGQEAAPSSVQSPTKAAKVELAQDAVVLPWTGDFDGMVKRRLIRVLTPSSRTHGLIDERVPRGLVDATAMKLEEHVNVKLNTTQANKVFVVVIPTSRDELFDSLVGGRGDIVAAGITVTPERDALADFTLPMRAHVREIAVTGPGAPTVNTVDDLAGETVAVRDKSLLFESLQRLNETFRERGKRPVLIKTVPAALEDGDILEMCNAGLLKIVVVDDLHARLWKQVLPEITVHDTVVVRDEGAFAWAAREGSPKLIAELNGLIKAHGEGTAFGNMLLEKYLQSGQYAKNAASKEEVDKFNALVDLFRRYGGLYQGGYLLMLAQRFLESRLDQPGTSDAEDGNQTKPPNAEQMQVGDISRIDPDIMADVEYMRFMMEQYYKDEPMDDLNKALFTFASYNVGAARIHQLRAVAATEGLDPNKWFNNVEGVVAETIGRETASYVSSIYKHYVAYTLTMEETQEKERLKPSAR